MTAWRTGGKSLSTRLFAILFASVFISFMAATAIAAYVSWTVYEGDAETRLTLQLDATGAQIQEKSDEDMVAVLDSTDLAETRITLVAADGVVLYDSLVDINDMENHANREEIKAARDEGESVVMRKSETTGTDSLYAAARVSSSGTVLRLAESRASLVFYISSLLAPLSLAVLVAALLSALLARAITRRILSPILNVDLDAPLRSDAYTEIRPLLSRVDAQRKELLTQNEQLHRAVVMRREFTGNVSHEMKSPLQVIGGYAELIEGGITSPEDTRRFAGLIRSESQSMRELIDDVLMLSRLDEGTGEDRRLVNVTEIASRVIERLASSAKSQNVEVSLVSERQEPAWGAEPLMEHAVYNLVDNAIRYGGACVEVDISNKDGWAVIAVSDDGPGVPVAQRERVFERFYRLDPSRSRATGGTGLGLAIVKHAAESMGGSVSVSSSEMGGACFTLRLPSSQESADNASDLAAGADK